MYFISRLMAGQSQVLPYLNMGIAVCHLSYMDLLSTRNMQILFPLHFLILYLCNVNNNTPGWGLLT